MRSVTAASAPKQRNRLEPRRLRGARPGLDVVGAEGGVGVGHEQQIELAAFGQPRDVDVMFERLPAVRIDVGIAPGGDMVAGAFDEQAKLHHGRTRGAGLRSAGERSVIGGVPATEGERISTIKD